MCRGFQQNERERLKIRAFYVHLAVSSTQKDSSSADSLTLHYLPRINGSALEINGSNIRPDLSAFVTLHRVVSAEKIAKGVVIFGSREKVKASEGLRFEIYTGDVKVLKGTFRKDEGQNWKVECTFELEIDDDEVENVKETETELCVEVEGHVEMIREKVKMIVMRRKRRGRCIKLEEIPEEREVENEFECCCCCCCECKGEVEMDDGDWEMEMEMDGVRWAVDVGIWVVCLGVGYLVTKASSKSLRRRRLI